MMMPFETPDGFPAAWAAMQQSRLHPETAYIESVPNLKGGWRVAMDLKKDQMKDADPEKNTWSHPGDAFGYGCRYFHKGVLREDRPGDGPDAVRSYLRIDKRDDLRWGHKIFLRCRCRRGRCQQGDDMSPPQA